MSYPDFLKSENLALYYSNKETEKEIITKIVFGKENQYYINKNNFIFDNESYKEYLNSLKKRSGS